MYYQQRQRCKAFQSPTCQNKDKNETKDKKNTLFLTNLLMMGIINHGWMEVGVGYISPYGVVIDCLNKKKSSFYDECQRNEKSYFCYGCQKKNFGEFLEPV